MAETKTETFNYDYVTTTARIALYDDKLSTPRVTNVEPAPTDEFIGKLAATIDEQAKMMGGKISYHTILEVTENFIHAQFREIVVSILDDGNTIRFADQGPGIADKDKAQKPGFSSAIEPMKSYIRGVGSGLPIVREWLDLKDGTIMIEDNMTSGAVVTISLAEKPTRPAEGVPGYGRGAGAGIGTGPGAGVGAGLAPTAMAVPVVAPQPNLLALLDLSERQRRYLELLGREGDLRVTDFIKMTGDGNSTVSNNLDKLRQSGLVEQLPNKRRTLTALGEQVLAQL